MNKHLFADGNGLKLIGTPGTSASFSSNTVIAAEGLNVCQNYQVELSARQLETVIQIKHHRFLFNFCRTRPSFGTTRTTTAIAQKFFHFFDNFVRSFLSFYHIKVCHGLFVTFVKYARAKAFVVVTRTLVYEGGTIVKKQFMSDPQN